MADKEITYKIQIDDSELAQKLAQVKNTIDSALANQNFSSVADYQPSAIYNAPNPIMTEAGVATPVYGNIQPLPNFQQYINPPSNIDAGIIVADQTLQTAYARSQADIQNIQGTVQQTFSKINETAGVTSATIQNTLDKVGVNFRTNQHFGRTEANFGITGDEGWIKNILGSTLKIGYDPDSSLSPEAYQEMQRHKLAYNLPEMAGGVAGFGLGMAGMGLGGPAGLAVGLIAGYAGEKIIGGAAKLFFAPALQDMQTADYINFTTMQRGTLLAGQDNQTKFTGVGMEAAGRMREFVKSKEGFLSGTSRREAEEQLKSFTELGGFDTARTSDEYMQRFDQMLEGHKKVMHALKISSQKATEFMAEMQRTGMVGEGTGQFSTFAGAAQALQAAGSTVGLSGTTLLNYGLQSQHLKNLINLRKIRFI